jgi:glyoxylase-like metal-dependent hydrolase (beta-lactamase superfamily II)
MRPVTLPRSPLFAFAILLLIAMGGMFSPGPGVAQSGGEWCDELPRPANAALPPGPVDHPWFQVYMAAPGVYALVEPWQFQEVISYLVLGEQKALLFDSGLGLVPIRPLVEQLTDLPVTLLNSHTHFDHVGGNHEFETVLAVDTPFTRANMAGFPHAELAGEIAPEALCRPPPEGTDLESYRTQPWQASAVVSDGQFIDLGGRQLEVLAVPGHTPDSITLLDRANGLLWTGDIWYKGPLWLFAPETSLADYGASLERLVGLAPELRQMLPAHNVAGAAPGELARTAAALAKIRAGEVIASEGAGGALEFMADGVTLITAQPLLDGRQGDLARGGSGLASWD